jgi:phospho-N-acetylmuramoyl-pentapeptide-transferase
MLYYLFEYLDKTLNISGGSFQYITFRSLAFILSLLLSTIYGIRFLQNQQVGKVRELGLAGQNEKAGTPTMGA